MSEVKILIERPPVWDSVCLAFNILPKNIIFAYGDVIYNPDNVDLPDHIIEHEKIHLKQHNHNNDDAALWWGKYLREPDFRVDQEAQAYAIQYLYISQFQKDRNKRSRILWDFARILSGPLYNNAINHADATKLIKKYAHVK